MAQRIKRPEFSWWPYRTVALLVPLIALGASAAALGTSTKTGEMLETEALTVFFALIGAGNAYLFAIAIGDLGKTVLTVPVGGFAGFLAVRLFGYPIATEAYLVLLGLFIFHALWTGLFRAVMGCSGLILVTIAFFGILNAPQSVFVPKLSVICAYPFICGTIAACMPYERSFDGVKSAWLAGTLNSIAGLLIAAVFLFLLGLLLPFFAFRGRSGWEEIVVTALLGSTLCVANYVCAQRLFYSVYRVSEEPEPSGSTETQPNSTAPAEPPLAPDGAPEPGGGGHNTSAST